MAAPDLAAGKRAAYEIYRQLRLLRISHRVAFQAAVERCGQFCPDTPVARIEAAAWEAVQRQLREECAAGPPDRQTQGEPQWTSGSSSGRSCR